VFGKVGYELSKLCGERRDSELTANMLFRPTNHFLQVRDDRVMVSAVASDSAAALAADLASLGMEITACYGRSVAGCGISLTRSDPTAGFSSAADETTGVTQPPRGIRTSWISN